MKVTESDPLPIAMKLGSNYGTPLLQSHAVRVYHNRYWLAAEIDVFEVKAVPSRNIRHESAWLMSPS